MVFNSWSKKQTVTSPHRRKRPAARRLLLESLENRLLLAGDIQWLNQFGSTGGVPSSEGAQAVDSDGNVYLVGNTDGTLPGQSSAGSNDAFVRKYDAFLNHLWTRQFGTSSSDYALGVAVDASGVHVVGVTNGALPGQTSTGDSDAFVRSYDHNGNELWTRQFGTSSLDQAVGVSVQATGVYVAGITFGSLPGQVSTGSGNSFVRKYDSSGNEVWTRQFGNFGSGANAITADALGIYVAGHDDVAAYVRKYDASGTEVWTRQFGPSGLGSGAAAYGVAVDGTGVYLSGIVVSGALSGQTFIGENDAFVRKYDLTGNVAWTHQFGTIGFDVANTISVDASGIYVAGYVDLALPGQVSAGSSDAFVRKYNVSGTEVWTRQFGTTLGDSGMGVSVSDSLVYVVGQTAGAFPGFSNPSTSTSDVFVRFYTTDGFHLATQQFAGLRPSPQTDQASSLDAAGNVYVAGFITGTLPGQTSAGVQDAFVRKYDPSGIVLWTRQFGTPGTDQALGISADVSGVYVVGTTTGTIPGQPTAGGNDAFIQKYDHSGAALWTRQFGTPGTDQALGISADVSGVYVAGTTSNAFPGQASAGGTDAFVRKYDASGTALWTKQFGTPGTDQALGISADASGAYVAGSIIGSLPGQISAGSDDAFVRKYDPSGNTVWTNQFGTPASDQARGIFADASGVYVAGSTAGSLPGQITAGSNDAFVRKYDPSGTVDWTRQFGTSGSESAGAISVAGTDVYVAGFTSGTLPGQTSAGGFDAFVRTYDTSGNAGDTLQFGTSGSDFASGVSADASGLYVSGRTNGAFAGQTSTGGEDAFVAKVTISGPNSAPTAVLDATPTSGLAVLFDGSRSADPDAGDSIAEYRWTFGDGTSDTVTASAQITHTYAAGGTYIATLVVVDSFGSLSRAVSILIEVDAKAFLQGQKFEDRDGDGTHDSNEPGLDGWTLELVDPATGVVLATQVTHSMDLNQDGQITAETERGWYRFGQLDPGAYQVREVLQPGWVPTAPLVAPPAPGPVFQITSFSPAVTVTLPVSTGSLVNDLPQQMIRIDNLTNVVRLPGTDTVLTISAVPNAVTAEFGVGFGEQLPVLYVHGFNDDGHTWGSNGGPYFKSLSDVTHIPVGAEAVLGSANIQTFGVQFWAGSDGNANATAEEGFAVLSTLQELQRRGPIDAGSSPSNPYNKPDPIKYFTEHALDLLNVVPVIDNIFDLSTAHIPALDFLEELSRRGIQSDYNQNGRVAFHAHDMQDLLRDEFSPNGLLNLFSQVNYVTHSAGGLDTRAMLDLLQQDGSQEEAERVANVVYTAPPFGGSSGAQLATLFYAGPVTHETFKDPLLRAMLEKRPEGKPIMEWLESVVRRAVEKAGRPIDWAVEKAGMPIDWAVENANEAAARLPAEVRATEDAIVNALKAIVNAVTNGVSLVGGSVLDATGAVLRFASDAALDEVGAALEVIKPLITMFEGIPGFPKGRDDLRPFEAVVNHLDVWQPNRNTPQFVVWGESGLFGLNTILAPPLDIAAADHASLHAFGGTDYSQLELLPDDIAVSRTSALILSDQLGGYMKALQAFTLRSHMDIIEDLISEEPNGGPSVGETLVETLMTPVTSLELSGPVPLANHANRSYLVNEATGFRFRPEEREFQDVKGRRFRVRATEVQYRVVRLSAGAAPEYHEWQEVLPDSAGDFKVAASFATLAQQYGLGGEEQFQLDWRSVNENGGHEAIRSALFRVDTSLPSVMSIRVEDVADPSDTSQIARRSLVQANVNAQRSSGITSHLLDHPFLDQLLAQPETDWVVNLDRPKQVIIDFDDVATIESSWDDPSLADPSVFTILKKPGTPGGRLVSRILAQPAIPTGPVYGLGFSIEYLTPGPHTLFFRARDTAGHESAIQSVSVLVDNQAPFLLTNSQGSTVVGPNTPISFQFADAEVGVASVSIDVSEIGPVGAGAVFTFGQTNLHQTMQSGDVVRMPATATDSVGNTRTLTLGTRYDFAGPSLTVETIQAGVRVLDGTYFTTAPSIHIELRVEDDRAGIDPVQPITWSLVQGGTGLFVQGALSQEVAPGVVYAGQIRLFDGLNLLSFQSRDRVGNNTSLNLSIQKSPGHVVTVGVGEAGNNADFGNFQLGTITGLKFHDENRDGDRDANEPTLEGWIIYLDGNANDRHDSFEPFTRTDAAGSYAFSDLGPGTYRVLEMVQPGWLQISPTSGGHVVTLTSGAVVSGKDFGNFELGTISGQKFLDSDHDGSRDLNEAGLPGWTIYVDTNGNAALDLGEPATVTKGNGDYRFKLLPGTHAIRQLSHDSLLETAPASGFHSVTLASGGQTVTNLDFGAYTAVDKLGGNILLDGSLLDVRADDRTGSLRIDRGALLTGPGTFTIDGLLTWLGGNMGGAGRTVVAGGLDLAGDLPKLLDERNLVNGGLGSISGAGNLVLANGAVLGNLAGARFDVRSDADLLSGAGAKPVINNDGDFIKSNGTGITVVEPRLTNTGTLQVQAGTLQFTNAAGLTNTGHVIIDPTSTLAITDNVGFVQGARGTTQINGVLTAGRVDIQGGSLSGTGSVVGDVRNAALLAPGRSPGILAIAGAFTQTETGVLAIEIGGLALGQRYDQLQVSGLATLDGALEVRFLDGFMPQVGDRFEIVTFGSRVGDFRRLTGLGLGSRMVLTPSYTDDRLILVAERINNLPSPRDDTATTLEDQPATVQVLANDADLDGDPLEVIGVEQPANGQVVVHDNGTLIYTPNGNFHGLDTLTYTVSDGLGGSWTAVVTVIVTSVNDAPVALAGDDQTVSEGTAVFFSGAGSSDTDGDDLNYRWDFGDGSATTGTVSGTHAYGDNGTYTVTVTVCDDDALGCSSDSFAVTVNNVAPTVEAGADQTTNEGTFISLNPTTFSDFGFDFALAGTQENFTATINWGDGTITIGAVSETSGSPGVFTLGMISGSHAYGDNGVYMVTVTVKDDDVGVGFDTFQVVVKNVNPDLNNLANTSPECGCGTFMGEDGVTISATFSDLGFDYAPGGTQENFTAIIQWGDGTSSSGVIAENPGSAGTPTTGTVTGSHVYATGGVFTITVTLTDDDGGSDVATTTTTVGGVGVVGDTLYVIGTDLSDHVTINQAGSVYKVDADFLTTGYTIDVPTAGISRIVVQACGGDDHVTISGGISLPAIIDGGSGSDKLHGGNGPNVIVGGAGDDDINGGSSRDVLIGGTGADRIVGNSADDLMIAGTTSYDANYAVLTDEILREWNSGRTFAQRVYNLSNGASGGDGSTFASRKNIGNFLNGNDGPNQTIFNDTSVDKLTGTSGTDWFFANQVADDGGFLDTVTDKASTETWTDTDF